LARVCRGQHLAPGFADDRHGGRHGPAVAKRRCETGRTPLVMLAMLARDGIGGFVGRGIWRPPLPRFERALEAVEGSTRSTAARL
jgi:hypothetical protein